MDENTRITVLHDHYKESFALIREREKSRDRLFLIVIALYALLALEIQYPAEFDGSLGSWSSAGGVLQFGALPLPALLNATWVLCFALTLSYCRVTVTVNRSYAYLHKMEDVISPLFGSEVYRREGKKYLADYPMLLDVAWVAYVFVFPTILIVSTIALIVGEWRGLDYPVVQRVLDTLVAGASALMVFLYLMEPWLGRRWSETKSRFRRLFIWLRERGKARFVVFLLLLIGVLFSFLAS